jgi:hypothetical protein
VDLVAVWGPAHAPMARAAHRATGRGNGRSRKTSVYRKSRLERAAAAKIGGPTRRAIVNGRGIEDSQPRPRGAGGRVFFGGL